MSLRYYDKVYLMEYLKEYSRNDSKKDWEKERKRKKGTLLIVKEAFIGGLTLWLLYFVYQLFSRL